MQNIKHNTKWTSELGFVLSALGSAIGLGSIWRFASLAYEGGGAAFIIAYIIACIAIGTPLILLEFSIGHKQKGSAPLSLSRFNPKWEWIGWWSLAYSLFVLLPYYSVIISWCLAFFKYSFTLEWGNETTHFFQNQFLNISSHPFNFGSIQFHILFYTAIIVGMSWIIIYRGINKGLEKANKIFIPLLGIIMVALFFWSMSLDGAKIGIERYFITDYKSLLEGRIWFNAFSQAFFSLSIGIGVMIVFASYLEKTDNLVKIGLVTVYGTVIFAIFSGCIVFAILGFMSKAQGVPIELLIERGPGLAFMTYPAAINQIAKMFNPTLAKIFSVLFFSSLTIAGLSSAVAILEANVRCIMDKLQCSRKKTSTLLALAVFIIAIVFTTQAGNYWIDIIDHFVTDYSIIMIGLLECVLIGWFSKLSHLTKHINQYSTIQITPFWEWRIQIVSPLILISLLFYRIIKEFISPYNNLEPTVLLIGVFCFFLTLIPAFFLQSIPWPLKTHTG